MKNRLRTHAFFIMSLLAVTTACHKKKDTQSKTELLIQQSWKHDTYGTDDNKDGTIDSPITMDACRLDDLITFKSNGIGTFDQGANMCFPTNPAVQEFSWQFKNNETQLEYADGTNTILSITGSQLVLAFDDNSVRYILTFKH